MVSPKENPQESGFLSDVRPLHPTMLCEYSPAYANFSRSLIDPLVWVNKNAQPIIPDRNHIIAVLGPSSSGKDTILQGIGTPFIQIRTHTTREKRLDQLTLDQIYTFVSPEQFSAMEQAGDFIETVPLGDHWSGTTVNDVTDALNKNTPLVVWRGEEHGVEKLLGWFDTFYPAYQRHVVFILPNMPMKELRGRIIQKRGKDSGWRIDRLPDQILTIGPKADYILLNPPQKEGPLKATHAMDTLFKEIGKR